MLRSYLTFRIQKTRDTQVFFGGCEGVFQVSFVGPIAEGIHVNKTGIDVVHQSIESVTIAPGWTEIFQRNSILAAIVRVKPFFIKQ